MNFKLTLDEYLVVYHVFVALIKYDDSIFPTGLPLIIVLWEEFVD
jgi:hypothetical protein